MVKAGYRITDILDIEKLKSICSSISNLDRITIGVMDTEGELLVTSNFARVCSFFHREYPESLKKCCESNREHSKTIKTERYKMYRCRHGLTVVLVPIVINDIHIGSLFTGQVFLAEPDIEFFRKQASLYGFDEKEYLEAVRQVPVLSESELTGKIELLWQISLLIGDLGYKNLQMELSKEKAETLNERFEYATSAGKVGTWDWDLRTGDLVWSMETYRILGFDPFSVEPSYELFLEKVHPDDRDFLSENVTAAVRGEKPYSVDCRIIAVDGQERICNATGKVKYDRKGTATHMVGTFQDITERKTAELALVESKNEYKNLFDCMLDGFASHELILKDGIPVDYRFLDVNPSFERMTSLAAEKIKGRRVRDVLPDTELYWIKTYGNVVLTGEPVRFENYSKELEKYFEVYAFKSGPNRFATIFQDVTQRVLATRELEKSLKEKETLLRELYHRTKNNMSVTLSLIDLQTMESTNPEVKRMFADTKSRIQSMAIVHSMLYRAKDLSSINLKEYIGQLIDSLSYSYSFSERDISYEFALDDVEVLIDAAIPCGLIITEMMTNIFKHAFPGGRKGEVKIYLTRCDNNDIILRIADNGAGVADDFSIMNDGKLGLQNIILIAENQLEGTVEFETDNGFACTVRFNDSMFEPRV